MTVRKVNYDNVFLEELTDAQAGQTRLIAMDHSHCITAQDLGPRISHIDSVRDEQVYGLFPEFHRFMRQGVVEGTAEQLGTLTADVSQGWVDAVPEAWQVDAAARNAVAEFLVQRAAFLAEAILPRLQQLCWRDQLFPD